MTRVVLPVPPIVSQLQSRLPDGGLDPANHSDCGESCLASAFRALRFMSMSPGCVRQSLGLPFSDGSTTASELAYWWNGVHGVAEVAERSKIEIWDELGLLRHHGWYQVVLGFWVQPGFLHWVLAYERTRAGVLVMEPFSGQRALYLEDKVVSLASDAQVWLR